MKNLKKFGLIKLLVLVALFTATISVAYAYWDSLQKQADVELKVGEGVELTLDAATYTEGVLVPKTALKKEGDVDKITITITASLSDELVDPAVFTVVPEFNEDFGDLFTISVESPETITKDAVVIITIEFAREPYDPAEYGMVASKTLAMTVVFTVAGE